MCNISKYGRLLEGGEDVLLDTNESACQTVEEFQTREEVLESYRETLEAEFKKRESTQRPWGETGKCSEVLKVAVGLLGLEIHEKPACWAEAWINLKDNVQLQKATGPVVIKDYSNTGDVELVAWQQRVLEHLQQLVARTEQHAAQQKRSDSGSSPDSPAAIFVSNTDGGGGTGGTWEPPHDWGPDFGEHLGIAEFCFKRISHAVRVLSKTERGGEPIVLRTYTAEMIKEVCTDLRQWLEQLSNIVSLYHVHLLDLDNERRRLARQLKESRAKEAATAKLAKNWENRHDTIKRIMDEDRMKRRAAALVGFNMANEDAPKYTQADVDEMRKKWEDEMLRPLLDEIAELKGAGQDARDRMKELKNKEALERERARNKRSLSAMEEDAKADVPGLDSTVVSFLVAALKRLSEKTGEDQTSDILRRLAIATEHEGAGMQELLNEIGTMRIKAGEGPAEKEARERKERERREREAREKAAKGGKKTPNDPAQACNFALPFLEAVVGEMTSLEGGIKGVQAANGLCPLITWTKEVVVKAKQLISPDADTSGAPPRVPRAPAWDVKSVVPGARPQTKVAVVQTTGPAPGGAGSAADAAAAAAAARDADAVRAQVDEVNARLERRSQELQSENDRLTRQREMERAAAQEMIAQLEAEGRKMKKRIAEMARRIEEMQRLLRARGLGQEIDEAMQQSGLADYIASSKDVFIRLYKDALNRMRRFAEEQARVFKRNQEEYFRIMKDVLTPFTSQLDPASGNPTIPLVSSVSQEEEAPVSSTRRRSPSPPKPGQPGGSVAPSPRRSPSAAEAPPALLETGGFITEQLPPPAAKERGRAGKLLTAPLAPMSAQPWNVTGDFSNDAPMMDVKQLGRGNVSTPNLGAANRQHPPVQLASRGGSVVNNDAQQVELDSKSGLLPPLSQKQLLAQQAGHPVTPDSPGALASRRPADKQAGEVRGFAPPRGGYSSPKETQPQQIFVAGVNRGPQQGSDLIVVPGQPPNAVAAAVAASAAGNRGGSAPERPAAGSAGVGGGGGLLGNTSVAAAVAAAAANAGAGGGGQPHRSLLLPGHTGGHGAAGGNAIGVVSGQRFGQQAGGSVSMPQLGRPARQRA